MDFLNNKLNTIFVSLIAVTLLLVAGHFCLTNTVHASEKHSAHHTSVTDQDEIKTCCQGNKTSDLQNFTSISNFRSNIDASFINTISTFYSTQLLPKEPIGTEPNISPHQFKESSFRILLC